MKKFQSILFVFLFTLIKMQTAHCQDLLQIVGLNTNSGNAPQVVDLAVDNNDNKILVGLHSFTGTVDFDPNDGVYDLVKPEIMSITSTNAFIASYNENNDLNFVLHLKDEDVATQRVELYNVETDDDGNI